MRKTLALVLIFVLLCGLFGCGESKENENRVYHVAELLGYQAHLLAQQLGSSVTTSYLENAGISGDLLSKAEIFSVAATNQPVTAHFLNQTGQRFITEISALAEKTSNAKLLTVTDSLAFDTQFYTPVPLEECMSVYLKYSEQCHIIVHFIPLNEHVISAQVYPLPWDAVSVIANKFFSKPKTYDSDDLQKLFERVDHVDISATVTGKQISAEYYSQLAQAAFAPVHPLTQKDIAAITKNTMLAANLAAYSKAISGGATSVAVYEVSQQVENQAQKLLGNGAVTEELKNWCRANAAAALPNSYCATIDPMVYKTNAILADALDVGAPGAIAAEDEKPVLVIMQINKEISLIVCVFPNAYNIYEISFACIPASFASTQDMVVQSGAVPMK